MDYVQVFIWVLAAFYVVAGVGPLANLEKTRGEYIRWGYPAWWPFVTALMEVAVGIMFLLPALAFEGAVLGMLIMVVAIATVLRSREYAHAIPPTVVLLVTALAGFLVR